MTAAHKSSLVILYHREPYDEVLENGKRVYALNASARYDTMDENKERIFRACAASFDVH